MVNMTAVVPEAEQFILSTLSPTLAQRRLALAVALALVIAFIITAGPLSTVQLARIDAFVPAYAAAMFVIDLITAVLLFAQFSILRTPALLVLSNGYLFTSLILIPWMLTFPGVFAPSGSQRPARRRTSEYGFALYYLACRLPNSRDRLCSLERCISGYTAVAGLGRRGYRFERCYYCRHRVCGRICRHSGRCADAAAHA